MYKEQVIARNDMFTKAVASIDAGVAEYTGNELQRDGLIQRFEYTIELARKTLKKIIDYKQIDCIPSPVDVIKMAHQLHIIDDTAPLIRLVKIRNMLSHTYDSAHIVQLFEELMIHRELFTQLAASIHDYCTDHVS